MGANTYTAIATQTLSTTASSVTFNSIPSGYTDLVIVAQTQQSLASSYCGIQLNGDTGNNYSQTALYGNGSSAASARSSNFPKIYPFFNTYETTGFLTTIYNIQNYSNTTTYKTVIARANDASAAAYTTVGMWRNTAAITSVTISTQSDIGSGTFASGSTFNLYGIANSDTFALATGGYIFQDSTYWYHVFAGSGTFTPKQSLSADILQVAGGGGGGSGGGGGGGAGGLLGYTSQSLTATAYTVTVGAGGAGGTSNVKGTSGSNSQFASLTASVGGGGGAGYAGSGNNASTGGSGGGGTGSNGGGASNTGAAGTSGQGYAGGNGGGSDGGAGGGGGAGAIGSNGTNGGGTGVGGNGGAGVNTYSSWLTVTGIGSSGYIAGGGGGGGYASVGTGGSGGGANGGTQTAASAPGLINTGSGGGGGGAGSSWAGSAGASGVVIVRYAK